MNKDQCCDEILRDKPRQTINTVRGEIEPPFSCAADARIRQVENGFIAEIGCKTFVTQDWKELADGLAEYWEDPAKAEAKFSKNVNSLPVGRTIKVT